MVLWSCAPTLGTQHCTTFKSVLCYNPESFVSARPCISSGVSRPSLSLSQRRAAAAAMDSSCWKAHWTTSPDCDVYKFTTPLKRCGDQPISRRDTAQQWGIRWENFEAEILGCASYSILNFTRHSVGHVAVPCPDRASTPCSVCAASQVNSGWVGSKGKVYKRCQGFDSDRPQI